MVEPLHKVRQQYEKANLPDVYLVNEHEKRIGILIQQAIIDQQEYCVYVVEDIPGPYPPVTLLQMVNHLLMCLRRKGYTVHLVSSKNWALKIEGWANPLLPELTRTQSQTQSHSQAQTHAHKTGHLSSRISRIVQNHALIHSRNTASLIPARLNQTSAKKDSTKYGQNKNHN